MPSRGRARDLPPFLEPPVPWLPDPDVDRETEAQQDYVGAVTWGSVVREAEGRTQVSLLPAPSGYWARAHSPRAALHTGLQRGAAFSHAPPIP